MRLTTKASRRAARAAADTASRSVNASRVAARRDRATWTAFFEQVAPAEEAYASICRSLRAAAVVRSQEVAP